MDESKIIDQLGGTTKVASLCEVTPGAVSQWRTSGIPRSQLKFLKVIRPEFFVPDERKTGLTLPALIETTSSTLSSACK